MKLSDLKIGSVFRFVKEQAKENFGDSVYVAGKHLVVGRFPEDRSGGGTEVAFEDSSGRHWYYWDYSDPLVELIGTGKLKIVYDD